jgi:hypothetical protein
VGLEESGGGGWGGVGWDEGDGVLGGGGGVEGRVGAY